MKRICLAILILFGIGTAAKACPPMVQFQAQAYAAPAVQIQQVSYAVPVAYVQTFFAPAITYSAPAVQFQAQANVYGSMQVQQVQMRARACASGCGARRGILGRRSVSRQVQRSVQRGR